VAHRGSRGEAEQFAIEASYRTHGDRFVYDRTRPALSDNRHRTHAVAVQARWHRRLAPAATLSVGVAGGRDSIDSNALGERTFGRGSAFVEMRYALGSRVSVHPGLRVDRYTRFGTSWSPALAATGWVTPRLRWRAAGGRTFRVPTFTELYYRDPNHRASDLLAPERAWSADAGLEGYLAGWTATATVFGRWDADVIDWVRESAAEPWRTTNVRDVTTRGLELGFVRQAGSRGQIGVRYTRLEADAPSLTLFSKYVLDYAPHVLAVSGSYGWRGLNLGTRLGYTRRADGREYPLVDLRVGRPLGRTELYLDVANLLDRRYQEIIGVAMPGRWIKLGVRLR
jgi:iron complex outermembrane receptor protein